VSVSITFLTSKVVQLKRPADFTFLPTISQHEKAKITIRVSFISVEVLQACRALNGRFRFSYL
jgi:hypothetical protein